MTPTDVARRVQQHDELRYWLALLRAPGIGAVGFRRILGQYPRLAELFNGQPAASRAEKLPGNFQRYLRRPDWHAVEQDLAWCAEPGNHIVTCLDQQYPAILHSIPDPPSLLFVVGNPARLADLQIAVVGSRNPSPSGERNARAFSRHFSSRGLTVTSGLATGIDAAAHSGALELSGRTIAVLGTGPDRIYPSIHRELAQRIADTGALVTELPPGTPPLAGNFPRRNRLISGLSLGVLIVEAALRSGSLITARLAAEQGRDVFAIPGSTHNPLARGCHQLIRQGAKLVEKAEHVLEELGSIALAAIVSRMEEIPQQNNPVTDSASQNVLDVLGDDPLSIDELVDLCGLTPERLSSMLLLLELEGHVAKHPGGRYSRSRRVLT